MVGYPYRVSRAENLAFEDAVVLRGVESHWRRKGGESISMAANSIGNARRQVNCMRARFECQNMCRAGPIGARCRRKRLKLWGAWTSFDEWK